MLGEFELRRFSEKIKLLQNIGLGHLWRVRIIYVLNPTFFVRK